MTKDIGIKKLAPKFMTSDGREFDDEESASTHENLTASKNKYEAARQEYAKHLFESQKTADGECFELKLLRDYWLVIDSLDFPSLRRVSFSRWNIDLDENDEAMILRAGYMRYRISELYWHEKNAMKALLEVRKRRLFDSDTRYIATAATTYSFTSHDGKSTFFTLEQLSRLAESITDKPDKLITWEFDPGEKLGKALSASVHGRKLLVSFFLENIPFSKFDPEQKYFLVPGYFDNSMYVSDMAITQKPLDKNLPPIWNDAQPITCTRRSLS